MLQRLNMLPKMQHSPFVKKLQRAVRQRQRQAVGAVLLLGQQAARVLADLAGGPQRVRPDDARERARARRRGARRRPRPRGAVRRRSRGRRPHHATTDGERTRSPREGRRRRQRPERPCCRTASSLRLWDPMLNKGAIWTYWKGAYRDTGPGRRRDDGHSDRQQAAAGSGTSRSTTTSSASASSRRSTTCSIRKVRNGHEQTYQEEVERCDAVKRAHQRRGACSRILCDARLLLPLDRGCRRRMGPRR